MKRWAADIMSLSRVVLLVPWIWCAVSRNGLALPIMAVIVASDLLDGRIARRFATVSGLGSWLDPLCDALVVVAAAIALGMEDARYLRLAGLMAMAFFSWGGYSLTIGRLGYTCLGKYNGTVCYLLVLGASAEPWLATLRPRITASAESALLGFAAIFLTMSTAENLIGMVTKSRSDRYTESPTLRE